MKIDKTAIISSFGLSVIHFVLVLVCLKFRPSALASGTPGSVTDAIESVLTQPGIWVADFMGCISERPMWWIFLVINSVLWGNVIAFVVGKAFGIGRGESAK